MFKWGEHREKHQSMVLGWETSQQYRDADVSSGLATLRNVIRERMGLSFLQCIVRERDGQCNEVKIPLPPNFELDDDEPDPEISTTSPSDAEPDLEVSPPSSVSSMEKHTLLQSSELEAIAPSKLDEQVDMVIPSTSDSLWGSLSSTTFCTGSDSYSRESSFCESHWDESYAWRFCRVWEDLPSPSPLTVSPCIEEEPVILCCARRDIWCPLAVDEMLVVGNRFFAQGCALSVKHDYSDVFAMSITNSVAGDSTNIFFRSTDDGQYLCCLSSRLCASSLMQGMAGNWARMELRPAAPGNHYCFHLYAPNSSLAPNASPVVPICYDEESRCLVQAEPEPGCDLAVFSLQTASSALLLKEIITLTQQCSEQRSLYNRYENLYRLQRLAAIAKGPSAEFSEELMQLAGKRCTAEENLVFLEDTLDFCREQLQFNLQYAGPGAAHGLPEACRPISLSSISIESESIKSAQTCDSDTEVSPLNSVKKALRLL
jgi:hypothetical protein